MMQTIIDNRTNKIIKELPDGTTHQQANIFCHGMNFAAMTIDSKLSMFTFAVGEHDVEEYICGECEHDLDECTCTCDCGANIRKCKCDY